MGYRQTRIVNSVLFLDFDGVLRTWPSEYAALEASCSLPTGAITQVAFERNRLERVVTGKISDAAWRQEVIDELGRRFPQASAEAAIRSWSESVGQVSRAVLKLIEEVRINCPVVLITNGTDRLSADLSRLGLSKAFDAIVNSSEVGFAKPSARIFLHALEVARTEADRTFFVDDSASHIAAARSLGIRSHHFQDATALGAFLAEYGLA